MVSDAIGTPVKVNNVTKLSLILVYRLTSSASCSKHGGTICAREANSLSACLVKHPRYAHGTERNTIPGKTTAVLRAIPATILGACLLVIPSGIANLFMGDGHNVFGTIPHLHHRL